MADTKAIVIGSSPTWRGVYNENATYYKENLVTSHSCIFKAAVNNFSGVPPIIEDEEGQISLNSTSAWICVLDNTKLYNHGKIIELPENIADIIEDLDDNAVRARKHEDVGQYVWPGAQVMVMSANVFEQYGELPLNTLIAVYEDED